MSKDNDQPATKNALEWTVFGISTVLVLGTLGTLAAAAIRYKDDPARLVVEASAPVLENGWFRVPVKIKNDGERVAANVEISVSEGDGESQRQAGFTVDFVPRSGERSGSVSFKDTGTPPVIRCEVVGYEEP